MSSGWTAILGNASLPGFFYRGNYSRNYNTLIRPVSTTNFDIINSEVDYIRAISDLVYLASLCPWSHIIDHVLPTNKNNNNIL